MHETEPVVSSPRTIEAFEILDVLDAVWAVQPDARVWLERVLAAVLRQLDQGLGGCIYFVDVRTAERPRYWAFTGSEHLRHAWLGWFPGVPAPLQVAAHTVAAFGTARGMTTSFRSDFKPLNLPDGWVDMLGINGLNSDGVGVAMAFPARHVIARPSESIGALLATLSVQLGRAATLMAPFASDLGPEVVAQPGPPQPTASLAAALGKAALRDCCLRAVRERRPLAPEEQQIAVERLRSRRLAVVDTFSIGGQTYTVAVDPMGDDARLAWLSPREIEVVRLAGTGLSNKAIADRLDIAVSTVSTLLARAMERLGCDSRAALIALVGG